MPHDDVAEKWSAFYRAHVAWKSIGADVEARVKRGEAVDTSEFRAAGVEVMRLAEQWGKARRQKEVSKA